METLKNDSTIDDIHSVSSTTMEDALPTSFSEFDESACGEPFFSQHLVLDFTPTEEDSDFVQKKCFQFWNFVNNLPEIQHLKVLPEKIENLKPTEEPQTSTKNDNNKSADTTRTRFTSTDSDVPERTEPPARTAVSMLEVIEDTGLIDRIFEAKLPRSDCSLGSREYIGHEELMQQNKIKKSASCACTDPHCVLHGPCRAMQAREDSATLKTLVKKMDEWDKLHPKSMEPPGHPPSLQHCILQRNDIPKE